MCVCVCVCARAFVCNYYYHFWLSRTDTHTRTRARTRALTHTRVGMGRERKKKAAASAASKRARRRVQKNRVVSSSSSVANTVEQPAAAEASTTTKSEQNHLMMMKINRTASPSLKRGQRKSKVKIVSSSSSSSSSSRRRSSGSDGGDSVEQATSTAFATLKTSRSLSPTTGAVAGTVAWPSPSTAVFAHACNSRAQLDAVLATSGQPGAVTMIEADLLVSSRGETIMAHPPALESDLSMLEFVRAVAAENRARFAAATASPAAAAVAAAATANVPLLIGIKLDFKDPAAVSPTLRALHTHWGADGLGAGVSVSGAEARYRYGLEIAPAALWLNADVLRGPSGAAPRFNADDFVRQCCCSGGGTGGEDGGGGKEPLVKEEEEGREESAGEEGGREQVQVREEEGEKEDAATATASALLLPHVALSIGWTTGTGMEWRYTPDMVDEMLSLCARHGLDNVTFPVAARLAHQSASEMQRLLGHNPAFTLTLWGEADACTRAWANTALDPKRTYQDLKQPTLSMRLATGLGRTLGFLA